MLTSEPFFPWNSATLDSLVAYCRRAYVYSQLAKHSPCNTIRFLFKLNSDSYLYRGGSPSSCGGLQTLSPRRSGERAYGQHCVERGIEVKLLWNATGRLEEVGQRVRVFMWFGRGLRLGAAFRENETSKSWQLVELKATAGKARPMAAPSTP